MSEDTWRALLEKARAELRADQASAAGSTQTVELDQTRVGRVSRMDALQMQAMAQATDRRRALELRQIDAALDRLDDGSFGECAVCGEMIAESRLKFAPANPLCLACAEAREA